MVAPVQPIRPPAKRVRREKGDPSKFDPRPLEDSILAIALKLDREAAEAEARERGLGTNVDEVA